MANLNFLRRARHNIYDLVSANTKEDQAKRVAAGQPRMYQQAKYSGDARPAPVARPQAQPDKRNFASKAFDQFNFLDNNRSFNQAAPTQSKSTFQQLGQAGGQFSRSTVGGIAKMANTMVAQAPQITSTARMLMADQTGNRQAWANANRDALEANKRFNRNSGGILNVGTIWNADEVARGDLKTGLRAAPVTAQAMTEAASLMTGAPVGKSIATQGVKQGIISQAPNLAKSGLINTAQGFITAKNQGAGWMDAAKAGALSGVVGTAGDVGLGYLGAGLGSGTKKLVGGINAKPVVKAKPDINTSRIAPDKIRVLSEYHDALVPNATRTANSGTVTAEMAKVAHEIAKKTGNMDLINGSEEAKRIAILDIIDAYEAGRGSVSDLAPPKSSLLDRVKKATTLGEQDGKVPIDSPLMPLNAVAAKAKEIIDGKPKPRMRTYEYTDLGPMTPGEKAALAELEASQINVDYTSAANELRQLAKQSGQPELYKKVMKQVADQNMSQAEAVAYIKQGLAGMRDTGTNAKIRMGVKDESAKPVVALKKKAEDLIAKTDAKAQATGKPPTVTEEIKISKALQEAGIDPATVPKSPVAPKVKPKVARAIERDMTVPKTPNAFERAWKSTKGVISEFGEDGKRLSGGLEQARNLKERATGDFIRKIPTVEKLRKDEFVSFVESLDALSRGEKPNMAPNIAQAVKEWSSNIQTIVARAQAAGIDAGDLGPYYFPRQYKGLFAGPQAKQKLINNLVKSGKAKTPGDAVKMLEFMQREYTRPFGNLEKSREIDMPGYEMTHEALGNYLERSFKRITNAEVFGADNKVINDSIANASKNGYDSDVLSKYLKIAMGDTNHSPSAMNVSNRVRQFNAVTSLATAGLSNLQQPINTMTVAGIGRSLKGIAKLLTPEGRKIAAESAVTLDHTINQLSNQQLGATGKITSFMAAPFFRQVEKFNRVHSAIVGADFGNALAKQGNTDMLAKLGVTGKVGKTLTKEQQIQAARGLTAMSQFKVDPMDLPGWAESPLGKVAFQFKSFSYKQTNFMYTHVLKEAANGNVMPLMRWLTLAPAVGAGSTWAKDKILMRGSSFENEDGTQKNPVQKYLTGLTAAGTFGLGNDLMYLGSKAAGGDKNLGTSIASTVGGPTVDKSIKAVNNISSAIGGDGKPLAKQAVSLIPGVGKTLSNKFLPYEDKAVKPAKEGEASTPAQLKEATKQEVKDLENRTDMSSTLQKLSDGRYAYTLDGQPGVQYSKNLKDARAAIAKDSIKNSDVQEKMIGDTYYYKNEEGEVKSKPKYQYEFDIEDSQNSLDMYDLKEAEDYAGWNEVAGRQITALEKLRDKYDKDNKDDKVDDVQKRINTLKNQMKKYAGYGGAFTKGKSGGSGGSAMSNSSKYAVSLSSGGGGAFGKFQGTGKAPVKFRTAARSGAKSGPKVTIKKSMV